MQDSSFKIPGLDCQKSRSKTSTPLRVPTFDLTVADREKPFFQWEHYCFDKSQKRRLVAELLTLFSISNFSSSSWLWLLKDPLKPLCGYP